jgi:hypothetical protein
VEDVWVGKSKSRTEREQVGFFAASAPEERKAGVEAAAGADMVDMDLKTLGTRQLRPGPRYEYDRISDTLSQCSQWPAAISLP